MHFSLLSLGLLTTSALATTPVFNEPATFHSMLARGADLSTRQDSGYYPSTRNCTNGGNTCESACGQSFTQCPSDTKTVFCYNKTTSHCCSDGSGNACSTGYYCASNELKETFCCPDGQDPEACAQAYSASGVVTKTQTQTTTVIIRKSTSRPTTATTTATTTAATDDTIYTPVDTPSSTTLPALTSPPDESDLSSVTFTGQLLPTMIGRPLSTTTGPASSQSSGGAGKVAGAGLAALAGALGVARLL